MNINIEITATSVSIVSACIAFIAMIVSVVNASLSRKNYKLQLKKYNDGKPNFRINDVLNSYAKNDKTQDIVNLFFFMIISNLSDKNMEINKFRLKVIGENDEIILLPVLQESYFFDGENIQANNSSKKWIRFDIPREHYENLKIIKYALEISDLYGNTDDFTVIYLREELKNYEDQKV